MKTVITEALIQNPDLNGKKAIKINDAELPGFGAQITGPRKGSYYIIIKSAQVAQDAARTVKTHQVKIGNIGDTSLHQARLIAAKQLAANRRELALRTEQSGTEQQKQRQRALAQLGGGRILTVREFFYDTYLDQVQADNKAYETHESVYRNHIDPCLGGMALNSVTWKHVRELQKQLQQKPVWGGQKKRQGDPQKTLSAGTIQRVLILLRHLFNLALQLEVPGITKNPTEVCRLRLKNLNNLLHFDVADAGISPTHWQASTFPERFRDRIAVIHDGIDTQAVVPNPVVRLKLGDSLTLTRQDEVITFVNRNLEPYRGYHVFMRALPEILKRRPNARVLIVGGDAVSYGARPPSGQTWKQIFAAEVRPQINDADWARVHFLGHVPYQLFIPLLQLSTVHVYLTYPFVLSWSLLEAMSAGCAIVASDTQPLREAITHDETGRLVDFFDVSGLANEVCALLDDPAARERLGQNARAFAQANYDLNTVCLPRQLEWVEGLRCP